MLDSTPIIDSLLALGVVDIEGLRSYLAAHVGMRGSRRASIAFDLADGRAQSPAESRVRVRLCRAGVPRPSVQLPVQVGGGIVLHPDLAWEAYKVALEYDGAWHDNPRQFHHDRKRLNLLVADGWLVIHATSERVRDDFPGLVREIKSALRSRGWRPRSG